MVSHQSVGDDLNEFRRRRDRCVRSSVNAIAGSAGVRIFVDAAFGAVGRCRSDGDLRPAETAVLDQLERHVGFAAAGGAADDDAAPIGATRFEMRSQIAEYPRPAPKELRFRILLLRHLEEERLQRQKRRSKLGESN